MKACRHVEGLPNPPHGIIPPPVVDLSAQVSTHPNLPFRTRVGPAKLPEKTKQIIRDTKPEPPKMATCLICFSEFREDVLFTSSCPNRHQWCYPCALHKIHSDLSSNSPITCTCAFPWKQPNDSVIDEVDLILDGFQRAATEIILDTYPDLTMDPLAPPPAMKPPAMHLSVPLDVFHSIT